MAAAGGKRIAVTGGIGSGKSRVCRYWASRADIPLINVDLICAVLLEKGNAGWQGIRNELAEVFFLADGRLDRKRLRQALFSDERMRLRMNELIHPLALAETMAAVKSLGQRTVLVDVPLLFEAGWVNYFDYRVVVYADDAICCHRVVNRDSIGPAEARQTVLAQLSMYEKVLRADHVINNSGSWLSTILEVIHLAGLIAVEVKEGQIITEST